LENHGNDKIELNNGTQIIASPQNVAGMLNNFFVEIIDDLLNQNISKINTELPKQRIKCCCQTIFLYPFTEYEIVCVSKSLKGKLSTGYDEILKYLVKQCIKHKKHQIPLYKKGDNHDVKNYRPIVILLVFSKILEILIYNRLIPFSMDNNILTEAQNGFRKNKPIDTASQTVTGSIQDALDR
jgi:sarcosine oxidase/L-pipecolate oxidase